MRIIDFKAKLVETEIEIALSCYHKIYQEAFEIPDLRQKLIAHIYNKLPVFCVVVEWSGDRLPIKKDFSFNSQEFGLEIETRVHEGIKSIFEENKDLITQQMR